MCVDVHAAASLKSGRVLGSKSRLWRGMGVSAQSVSPKFYSSRTRPSEPGSPSSHQEPPAGIELVQVRSVELAVQPKPVFNVVHQAVHEAIRIHRNGWHLRKRVIRIGDIYLRACIYSKKKDGPY